MKCIKIIFLLYLIIALFIRGSSQTFSIDASFQNYLQKLKPGLRIEQENLLEEDFDSFVVKNNSSGAVVTLVSFDSLYVLGISQNLFVTDSTREATNYFHFIAWSKKERKMLLFNNGDSNGAFGKNIISVSSLIPSLSDCSVFTEDYECKGMRWSSFSGHKIKLKFVSSNGKENQEASA